MHGTGSENKSEEDLSRVAIRGAEETIRLPCWSYQINFAK